MTKVYISQRIDELCSSRDKALQIFSIIQSGPSKSITRVDLLEDADYIICDYDFYDCLDDGLKYRVEDRKFQIEFESDEEFTKAMYSIWKHRLFVAPYHWDRFDPTYGYEVTSRGDFRFSPFFMVTQDPDNPSYQITLEDYFQLIIKGYRKAKGFTNWREAKGLEPLCSPSELESRTKLMYKEYLNKHKSLMYELAVIGIDHSFTDMFGTTDNSQARYYADLLNEFYHIIK